MKNGWIAYVGPISFPWGQAGSRRVCGIARSLADGGYRVVIGSGDSLPATETNLDEGESRGSVSYIGLSEFPRKNDSFLRKFAQIFWHFGGKTVNWLDSQTTKPSYVFVYGGGAPYMLRLLPWCRKHGIPLITDVVEWYDPRQLAGGFFGPFNISSKLALRFLYPRCDGVVAISRLLANYYTKKGCPVVRIPPTVNLADIDVSRRGNGETSKLTLIYAGTPGNKDMLGNVIRGVTSVDPTGGRIKLLVMGPSLEEVTSLCGGAELPASVNVLGRVPQADVASYVQSADFSVLLREPLRFANAGFPTKFVESMANGTPVIANLTSDLGLYLRDGIEGLICEDYSVESFASTLNRALMLSPVQMGLMRSAARNQAEQSFDFRVYSNQMSEFLAKV